MEQARNTILMFLGTEFSEWLSQPNVVWWEKKPVLEVERYSDKI